jgi:hypothetical protein
VGEQLSLGQMAFAGIGCAHCAFRQGVRLDVGWGDRLIHVA